MAETTLPLALSAEEIVEAVSDRIKTRLFKDGFLNRNLAYQHYSAKISIHLEMNDLGRAPKVDVEETVVLGTQPEDDENKFITDIEMEIEPKPPNEERVETGQAVPVETADGKRRTVKYARHKARKT